MSRTVDAGTGGVEGVSSVKCNIVDRRSSCSGRHPREITDHDRSVSTHVHTNTQVHCINIVLELYTIYSGRHTVHTILDVVLVSSLQGGGNGTRNEVPILCSVSSGIPDMRRLRCLS